jgi:hypothetical protein
MSPIELKKKWHLTYPELAVVLGYKSEYTVRSWNMPGKHRRNPPETVFICCQLLDEKWEKETKKVSA